MIELGDVTRAASPEPAPRRLDRRRARPAGLLAAVIAVLACTAATPVAEVGVRPLWSSPPWPEYLVDVTTDAVYAQSAGKLTAYDLADGRARWTWRPEGYDSLQGASSVRDGGPVLATVVLSGTAQEPPGQVTVALHPDTGAELWRRPGTVRLDTVEGDSALLIGSDTDGAVARLSRIRVADGQPLWTTPVPEMQEAVLDSRVGRVVFTTARGDVTALRYADGTRLAARRIEGVAPDEAGVVRVSIGLDGGRLLLYHNEVTSSWSTVLEVSTLRELYRTAPADGPVSGCGVVFCRFDAGGFSVVDPATGRPLWREPSVGALSLVTGDRMLLELTDGRLQVLVDSRTGRPLVTRLRGVAVLDRVEPDSFLLLRPAGRTVVSRVDLATGDSRLLGALPAVPDPQTCQSVPGHLVCLLADRFVVAAVPR